MNGLRYSYLTGAIVTVILLIACALSFYCFQNTTVDTQMLKWVSGILVGVLFYNLANARHKVRKKVTNGRPNFRTDTISRYQRAQLV